MNLIPLVFFWVIGAAMHYTRGHYMDSAGLYTLSFFVTVVVMAFRERFTQGSGEIWIIAWSFCILLFVEALQRNPQVIYASRGSPYMNWLSGLDHAAVIAAFALVAAAILTELSPARAGKPGRRFFLASAGVIFACVIGGELLVPLLSPRPFIDVFVTNTLAVDYFLKGVNPYTQAYPDIYRGFYDYKAGFHYFPGLLYWLAPFRALFGDIRYGYIFANLLIALGLHGLARKLRAPEPLRWLAPLVWLVFPVTYFVLEQSWIDTILIALAVLALWSVEEEKWTLAGILMGAAFSVKQYGFLVGLIACLAIWRRAGMRAAIRSALIGAAVVVAVIAPFAIANWSRFYAATITAQTASAVRLDAYNATSFLALRFHWLLPGWLQAVLSALGIAAGAFYVARKRAPSLADCAVALFLGYGVAFLFGKFAFCNYHYLLAGLLLLYLVSACAESVRPESRRTTETSEAPSARVGT